jgi:mercuric ion transport protein
VRVELVFDATCPNVDEARNAIRAALLALGAPAKWTEWEREAEATPLALRAFGSPSILVNGHDVTDDGNEAGRADANSCRVYVDECGCLCGAPSMQQIVKAIEATRARVTIGTTGGRPDGA